MKQEYFAEEYRNYSLQGSICEQLNFFTRVEMIRNLHYLSLGLFQKRYPECHLKVKEIQSHLSLDSSIIGLRSENLSCKRPNL